jgi:dihydropteroate synthase
MREAPQVLASNEGNLAAVIRPVMDWKLRSRTVSLGSRTLVCGIVNITPDSFSDGGAFADPDAAVAHGLRMLDEGADLLDLGAESTRPGSRAGGETPAVSADEELSRLLPVLEGILNARPQAILSVDTYKARTARAAIAAGAEIINDVSGLDWDAAMAGVCADAACGVILMHTRGRPDGWAAQPQLAPDELIRAVRSGLQVSLDKAARAGIAASSIVLDPGYGFGKRGDENFALLGRQRQLLSLGRPLLAGVSRKSFLGKALAPLYAGKIAPVDRRETASVSAAATAILNGASIIRAHCVREAVEGATVADLVLKEMENASINDLSAE